MTRYFIAANIWLVFALVASLGQHTGSAVRFSSFLNGPEIDTYFYNLIIFVLLAVSAVFFVLTWKTHKKS